MSAVWSWVLSLDSNILIGEEIYKNFDFVQIAFIIKSQKILADRVNVRLLSENKKSFEEELFETLLHVKPSILKIEKNNQINASLWCMVEIENEQFNYVLNNSHIKILGELNLELIFSVYSDSYSNSHLKQF